MAIVFTELKFLFDAKTEKMVEHRLEYDDTNPDDAAAIAAWRVEQAKRDADHVARINSELVEGKKEALFTEALSRIQSFLPDVDTFVEAKAFAISFPALSNPTPEMVSAEACVTNVKNRLNWLKNADLTDPTVVTQIENYDPATDLNWP